MIKTLGNNIVNAFTGGNPVKAIYTYGEKVWPVGGPYYIKWTPSSAEGQFNVDGTTYDLNTFGGIYYWSTGVINDNAFSNNDSIQSIKTNATIIGSSAFYSCYLNNILLPNCNEVGWNAFRECINLTTVSLPVCKVINYGAFCNCSSLASIDLPMCSKVSESAFYNCTSLSQVNLPVCKGILFEAFYSCSSLTSIDLPMCESIYMSAFYNCTSLSQVNLPVCKGIGSYAFHSCSSLTSIDLPMCRRIYGGVFYNCISLSQVNLPVCSSIGSNAFYGCSSLTSIDLPMCMYINSYVFENCTSLSQVNLPVCSNMGNAVFYNCKSLNSLTLCTDVYWTIPYPSRMLSNTPIMSGTGSIYVRSDTYSLWITSEGWSSLSDRFVSVETSDTKLGFSKGTVYGTTYALGSDFTNYLGVSKNDILSIDLSMCKFMDYEVCSDCTSLSQVSLPVCSYIRTRAFWGCSSLSIITIGYSGVCSLSSSVFYNTQITSSTGSIYVPASLVDAYKFASDWSQYSNRIYSIR